MRILQKLLGYLGFLVTMCLNAQEIPYPPIQKITGIVIDWITHQRHAQGSDNFQLTWADDNNQYGIWGDGNGFAEKYRASFGVARIEGEHDNYKGYDRYGNKESSEYEAKILEKSWGIICVKKTLYAWVHPDKKDGWGNWSDHNKEARLYISKDHGATWKPATWAFSLDDDLLGGNILQFGKNYSGAADKYVYHYMIQPNVYKDSTGKEWELQIPGRIFLLRVHKNKLMDRGTYEFFEGFKGNNPVWTINLNEKIPVFVDKNGVGSPVGISYNKGLKRYLLSTEHEKPESGMIGIFESPNPWGPWSTVAYATSETWLLMEQWN